MCCNTQRQGAQRASHSCIQNLGSTITQLTSTLWQRLRAPRQSCSPNSANDTGWNLSCIRAVKRELLKGTCLRIKIGKPKIAALWQLRISQDSHSNPELQVSSRDYSQSRRVLPTVQHQCGMSDKERVKAMGVASLSPIPKGKIELHRTQSPRSP